MSTVRADTLRAPAAAGAPSLVAVSRSGFWTPIDALWHRLFGLDVTLWSPPHLLGLAGGVLNAAAGWVIAREAFPRDSRARQVALVLAGALVAAGLSVALQPGIRIAYVYGGVRFFTYAILGALLLPLALVVTARLS